MFSTDNPFFARNVIICNVIGQYSAHNAVAYHILCFSKFKFGKVFAYLACKAKLPAFQAFYLNKFFNKTDITTV